MSFSDFLAPWQPTWPYGNLECCTQAGVIYQNQTGAGFTSAPTWAADSANWTNMFPTGSGAPVGSAAPLPDASASSTGSSASSSHQDHVHPRVNWSAADRGFITETFEPEFAQSSVLFSAAGTLQVVKAHVPAATSITNVWVYVSTAGATLTANQCFVALYQGGPLLGLTGDQSGVWNATGVKEQAFVGGPLAVAAGDVQVAFWYNGTTPPKFASGQATSALANAGLAAANSKYGTANTGITTSATAPATLGALTAGAGSFWVALS